MAQAASDASAETSSDAPAQTATPAQSASDASAQTASDAPVGPAAESSSETSPDAAAVPESTAGADESAAVPGSTAGADGGDEPEGGAARVKRAWQLVLQQAEAQSVALYAVIKDARVHADGERLVVALPSSLALGKASTPDNRELLTAIIERTTGDAPDLQFVLLETGPAQPAAPQSAPDAGLTIAQRIALAKRELDASELPDDD